MEVAFSRCMWNCEASNFLRYALDNFTSLIFFQYKEEGTNKQAECNRLAIQSVRALARLGGYMPEPNMTPDNPIVKVRLVYTYWWNAVYCSWSTNTPPSLFLFYAYFMLG